MIKNRTETTDRDGGFTLIELMVVVLVIAILLAIAIPTFLGARSRAQDTVAKTSLRNSLSAAQVRFQDTQDFTTATAANLTTDEASLTFIDSTIASPVNVASSTGGKTVSVNPTLSTSTAWGAAARSSSGKCFYVMVTTGGSVTYGSGNSSATCTGTQAGTAATSATPSAGGW